MPGGASSTTWKALPPPPAAGPPFLPFGLALAFAAARPFALSLVSPLPCDNSAIAGQHKPAVQHTGANSIAEMVTNLEEEATVHNGLQVFVRPLALLLCHLVIGVIIYKKLTELLSGQRFDLRLIRGKAISCWQLRSTKRCGAESTWWLT